MSVLVTGGLGYIGSHTCVELMNAGQDVVVVDYLYNCKKSSYDRIKALVGKDFSFYECDIRDAEGLSKHKRLKFPLGQTEYNESRHL